MIYKVFKNIPGGVQDFWTINSTGRFTDLLTYLFTKGATGTFALLLGKRKVKETGLSLVGGSWLVGAFPKKGLENLEVYPKRRVYALYSQFFCVCCFLGICIF